MNERIKLLAEQSNFQFNSLGGTYTSGTLGDNLVKFAELIVQECIDVVDVGGEFVSRPKMVERLKQHFGVEE